MSSKKNNERNKEPYDLAYTGEANPECLDIRGKQNIIEADWRRDMDNWKSDRVASALNGTNPTVLAKMKSGFAVLGDAQFLPGYCVLIAYPKAGSLNDFTLKERSAFLTDMTIIGDAIIQVYNPLKINYDILGNTDAFLHAHIFPRYDWEEHQYRVKPVWLYPSANWSLPEYQYPQEKYEGKKAEMQMKLNILMNDCYAQTGY